ncbi:site-specific DNA-methyltransferase [Kytococcus sedentarius]|uniref:site-specific DNA-methyltransferase n=1 Tax=Kytococcus sedentarius TaxID=1276 RepID=UPI003879E312
MSDADHRPIQDDPGLTRSEDAAAANLEALRALFPSVVSESGVDVEALRDLVGDDSVEAGGVERFGLAWPGKAAARRAAYGSTTKTLVPLPEESVGWDETGNVIIEGDNLEVMQALQKSYAGKVGLITIDPPYNTSRDFVYDDDFGMTKGDYAAASGQVDESGARLRSTTEFGGRRHSAWLSMMYPRLVLARSLLAEGGSIWITLDHTENAHCRVICDEIFGAENFVGEVSWQKTWSVRNDALNFSSAVDSVIVYRKSEDFSMNKLPRTHEMDAKYSSPDGDSVPWQAIIPTAGKANTNQGMVYAIQNPFTGEMLYPPVGRCWAFSPDRVFRVLNEWVPYRREVIDDAARRAAICRTGASLVKSDVPAFVVDIPLPDAARMAANRRDQGEWPELFFTRGGEGGLSRKHYLKADAGRAVSDLWLHGEVGHTAGATKELAKLFPEGQPFDTPKPVKLIQRIVQVAAQPDDLVLDFFAGSGTAAEAVMAQNAADGGSRRFMLVQLDEATDSEEFGSIIDVTRERVRRAGRKVVEEAGLQGAELDTGFRAYRLTESGIRPWAGDAGDLATQIQNAVENLDPGRSEEDLVVEMMLRLGLELTEPVETREIAGSTVYSLGAGALYLCLADGVDRERGQRLAGGIVAWRAEENPVSESQVILRDSGFVDDGAKLNTAATLVQGGFPTLTTI